jgi:hypothetical protein
MRKLVASCSVVLVAVAVLAACGSSGSSKANPLSPGTNKNNSGGSTASGNDQFSQLVANASKQKFKITYSSGTNGDTTTYAQDGNGNSVYGSGDTQVFTSASSTVSCNKDSNGKYTCIQSAGTGTNINPFLTYANLGKSYLDALGSAGTKSTKSIAGRTAQCVTFKPSDLGGAIAANLHGSASYCVDKDTGVLLEITGTDDSGKTTTAFEVTKFETPADSDFTPPATPETLPSVSIPGYTGTIPGGG